MITLNTSHLQSEEINILQSYVDPAAYAIILVTGLYGNCFLMFMFLRHRKIRTAGNTMVINLVVSDILSLGINAPLHYMNRYDDYQHNKTLCIFNASAMYYLRATSALSVVALCVQRFVMVLSSSRLPARSSTSAHTAYYIILIWTLSLANASPPLFVPEFYKWLCTSDTNENISRLIVLVNFCLYCVILPSLMLVLSVLTARRIKKSVRNMPGDLCHPVQEQLRIRSARVVISLAVVFVFSYFPFHTWCLIVYWWRMDRGGTLVLYTQYITKHLLFANGCFNPIALLITSSTFRRLFVGHIRKKCHSTNS